MGVVVFKHSEGWTALETFYFCFITLTTVGLGDFVPSTVTGEEFLLFFSTIGLGMLAVLITALSDSVGANIFRSRSDVEAEVVDRMMEESAQNAEDRWGSLNDLTRAPSLRVLSRLSMRRERWEGGTDAQPAGNSPAELPRDGSTTGGVVVDNANFAVEVDDANFVDRL